MPKRWYSIEFVLRSRAGLSSSQPPHEEKIYLRVKLTSPQEAQPIVKAMSDFYSSRGWESCVASLYIRRGSRSEFLCGWMRAFMGDYETPWRKTALATAFPGAVFL